MLGPVICVVGLFVVFFVGHGIGLETGDDGVGVVAAFAGGDKVFHVGNHFCFFGGIGEPLPKALGATFAILGFDQVGADAGARRGIDILIVRDREALAAQAIETPDIPAKLPSLDKTGQVPTSQVRGTRAS